MGISSPRNFCNIPDYIDGLVMYEYTQSQKKCTMEFMVRFFWDWVYGGLGHLVGPPNQYA